MDFDTDSKYTAMHYPTVIARNFILKVDKHCTPSHAPPVVGEKGEVVMLDFTSTGVFEQTYLDLPEDCTRNWITHVSPVTKDEQGFIMILPLLELLCS